MPQCWRWRGLAPAALILEVPPEVLAEGGGRPARAGESCASGGVRLAVDISAAGHGSLARLSHHPVDLVLYDPLFDSTTVRHILVRHEQGAGHAATGYAQATGRPGVCLATSGPGATNLVTAITDAFMDSTPIVAIASQGSATPNISRDAFRVADTPSASPYPS